LGYIVPSKFTKVGAAKELRSFLAKNQYVNQIISFGANQIFLDKTTYTCLLILHKKKQPQTTYYEVKSYRSWIVRDILASDFDTIDSTALTSDTWVLVPASLKPPFNSIVSQSQNFADLIGEDNIYNGIQTSANNIYIHKPDREDENYFYFTKDSKPWKIEKQVTKPYFKTASGDDGLHTYRPFKPNTFVIYPYIKVDGKIEFIEIEDLKNNYPFAFEYLSHYKAELSKKERDIKPTPVTPDEWYRYGRHQSLDKCDVPSKIIVGVLSQGNKYAIDYFGTLISSGGTAGYCMISIPESFRYSVYYIQALLNSKYLEWVSSLYGEVFRGGYIARGTKVLKQLPIRVIDFNKPSDKKIHDDIAAAQKQLIETQGEIDNSKDDKRKLPALQRQFDTLKARLDSLLKQLYNLGEMDNAIPLISKLYATD
jgi:hypothetical protein